MVSRRTGVLRSGVAFAVAGIMLLPANMAFAVPEDAQTQQSQTQAVQTAATAAGNATADSTVVDNTKPNAAATKAAATAKSDVSNAAKSDSTAKSNVAKKDASSASAKDSLLTPASKAAESGSKSGAAANGAKASKAAKNSADKSGKGLLVGDDTGSGDIAGTASKDGNVTIVVQLDNTTAGVPWFRSLFGVSKEKRHESIKNSIRELAAQQPATSSLSFKSAKSATKSAAAAAAGDSTDTASAKVQDVQDYYHAIDGFAVKAPAGILDEIRSLPGVKRAFVEHRYSIPDDQTAKSSTLKNQSSLDMTAADRISQKGDGQTIAIIDSGLDTAHEAFKGDLDDAKVKETKADAEAKIRQLGHGKYVSEKIPFAHDYADNDDDVTPSDLDGMEHGTHVAGIAAANSGDQIRGTAPNAQIIPMKVADDFSGGIYDSALLAAIDDAAALGVDTVNMSLGSDAGFADEATSTYGDAMKTLRDGGATVNVAAGNAGTAASGNQSGKNLPYASDPDSSVISSPSSFGDAFSVASVNNAQPQSAFLGPDGRAIGYNLLSFASDSGQSTGQTTPDFYTGDHTLADGKYEFVDGGIGSSEDQTRLANAYDFDLSGKIVLVKRGGTEPTDGHSLTFTDKLLNVGTAIGAAAVVFYNNSDAALTGVAIKDGTVVNYPVVAISGRDGEALVKAANKTITLKKGTTATPSDYTMSDFTSWGVTPDLKLKPEITAPGGNIWSSVPGDKYEYMSGTSMATPQMAGISAQIHEYVENDAKFRDLSAADKAKMVTRLLMSTARPVASGDSYASPRQQGAGLADAAAAVKTPVYLTVDGASDDSRPKADLGESADGRYSFTLTLHNLGDKDRTYTPDAQALSEQVADGLLQNTDRNWTGKGIAVAYSGKTYDAKTGVVTVPAGGTTQLTVSVTAEAAFKDYVAGNLPNGAFVEGFARLRATGDTAADGADLSAPFVGFYGDWSKAPVFDSALWEKGSNAYHIYGTALANPTTGAPLGVNPLDESATAGPLYDIDPAKMVVSRTNYSVSPTAAWPLTGLLRNVDKLDYEYTDAKGAVVKSDSYDHVPKSTLNVSSGSVLYAEARLGNGAGAFDGKDDNGKNLPDGTYTLQQTGTTAGPGSAKQKSGKYNVTLDTAGPKISNMKLAGEGDAKTFSFDATDTSWLSAVDFHDPTTGAYFKRILAGDDYTTNTDGSRTWHFEVKVSDIAAAWTASKIGGSLPNSVPLYAWDYGVNPSAKADAVMTPVAATGITLSKTALTLAPGQKARLTATVQPEDSTEKELDWSSADESKVTVDAAGTLTAVAPTGDKPVTVTAASKLNPSVKATTQVTVADVSEETGIVMSQDSATVEPGKSIDVTAIVAPGLAGRKISWTSSDEKVAIVATKAGQSSTTATVTAGDQVGTAKITATVDGKSATMDVKVQPSDFAKFVFDKDGTTLLGYTGSAREIVIPNNTKAIADQAFAQTSAVTITVPASVEKIGAQAFTYAGALTTVTFENDEKHPSQLKHIGDKAFDQTGSLDTVNLPAGARDFTLGTSVFSNSTLRHVTLPASLTEIPADTFNASAQLYDVTISADTTAIGDNAFNADLSFGEFKLTDAEGNVTKQWPQKLETIGGGALAGTNFTGTVELPKSLRTIGDSAFALVKADFVLNDGLVTIGANAFSGTYGRNVVIPDSVTAVGSGAFCDMPKLVSVTLGRNIPDRALIGVFTNDPKLATFTASDDVKHYRVFGGVLFDKAGSTLIDYPNANASGPKDGVYTIPSKTTAGFDATVTEIAAYGFYLNSTLKGVNFTEGLKTIGDSAFLQTNLTEVVLPKSLETVSHAAFMSMAGLKSVDLGGTVTVSGSAFYSDPVLTDINMRPEYARLKTFGSLAFGQSAAIRSLDFPDSVTDLGGDAFSNITSLKSVHLGAGITTGVEGVFTGANELAEITVSDKNPVFSATGNVLYQNKTDGLHLVLSAPGNPTTEYTVKDGTVAIDAQAFRNNHTLRKLTLPASLKSTTTGSFNSADALEEVVFPDGFERSKSSFLFAEGLKYVEFGTKTKSIADEFWGHRPTHLVVRGGVNGSYSGGIMAEGMQTAYFGKGMTNVNISDTPSVVVVPSDLAKLKLAGNGVVYAPADTDGYRTAVAAVGADRVKAYTPLTLTATVDGEITAGAKLTVAAKAAGGVDEVDGKAVARQYRFVAIDKSGKTTVLQDWSDASTASWTVPAGADGLIVRAFARDVTWYSVSADARTGTIAVDKTALGDAIASAKALEQGSKTDEAWKTLQDAIAAAQKAYDNTSATQDDVRKSTDALNKAVAAFKASADGSSTGPTPVEGHTYEIPIQLDDSKQYSVYFYNTDGTFSGLKPARVTYRDGKYEALITTGSSAGFGKAPTYGDGIGDGVAADKSAVAVEGSLDDYDNVITWRFDLADLNGFTVTINGYAGAFGTGPVRFDLANAKDVTPGADVDKSALTAAIASARALEQGSKTDEAWKALQDAIAAAQKVADSDSAKDSDVTAAVDALNAAIAAFKNSADKPATVDKSGLRDDIAAAKALEQGKKTDEAWKALQNAIASAQQVFDNGSATADEVTHAQDALRDAVKAFTASADKTDESSSGSNGNGSGSTNGSGSASNAGSSADGVQSGDAGKGKQTEQSGRHASALSRTGVAVTALAAVVMLLAAAAVAMRSDRLRALVGDTLGRFGGASTASGAHGSHRGRGGRRY
ncbi:leucine-rich repeat protein [Bifidobacterium primatium]|nr:leucine-rich repeat protein [Bifidobacterium primatium]